MRKTSASGVAAVAELMLVTIALEQLMKGKKSHDGTSGSGGSGAKKSGDRGKIGMKTGKQKKLRTSKIPKKKGKFDIANVRCYNCNENGHFQSDCPEPEQEKVNLAEQEEEDPALFDRNL
jgi:hypothetical protein